jgi:hypothetical protein
LSALLVTLALLGLAWTAHLAWWRVRLPQRHTRALLLVFAVVPAAVACLWLAGAIDLPLRLADVPGMALLYAAATGCYLITYAGVEETSPSLAVVRRLEVAGAAGCAREDLSAVITADNFVKPRLEALRRDGLVIAAGSGPEGFVLSARGRSAARAANLLARAFRIRENA